MLGVCLSFPLVCLTFFCSPNSTAPLPDKPVAAASGPLHGYSRGIRHCLEFHGVLPSSVYTLNFLVLGLSSDILSPPW